MAIFQSERHRRSGRPPDISTTSETTTFEGLWIFDFVGRPGLWTVEDSGVVEDAIQAAYACNAIGAYYKLVNATVRLDLIDTNYGSGDNTRTFPLPVSIEGATNLTD
jgi:hypothetical protein